MAWAMRQRSVSRPRSSNRTCGFPASGFPTGFTRGTRRGPSAVCVAKQWAMADAPSNTDRRPSSPRGKASSEASGYAGVFQAHRQSPILGSSKAHQKQGPFPPPALPGLTGRMALSDSRPTRRLCDVGAASPSRDGSPTMTRITFATCRAQYPGGSRWMPVSIASPLIRPSPIPRRVGIRIFTFEACSGFTRVTARWIAQPPKAAFVTRLQPSQLPDETARQLPEQSTTLRVEPSSTGDSAVGAHWEASGYTVRGAALSGLAAEAREGGSGIKSRTIASLEHAWGHGRDQLTKRDVLVIDEAGMVGSRQMERVLSNAAEAGAKVVLVGNPEQPQAIEPRRELHCPSRARSRRASTISPPTRAGKPALSSSRKESFPATAELCAMRDHPRNGPLTRRGGWIGHQLAHDRLARARVGTGT